MNSNSRHAGRRRPCFVRSRARSARRSPGSALSGRGSGRSIALGLARADRVFLGPDDQPHAPGSRPRSLPARAFVSLSRVSGGITWPESGRRLCRDPLRVKIVPGLCRARPATPNVAVRPACDLEKFRLGEPRGRGTHRVAQGDSGSIRQHPSKASGKSTSPVIFRQIKDVTAVSRQLQHLNDWRSGFNSSDGL